MNGRQSSHPSSALLTAFAVGSLSDEEMAAVERHVSECDTCCQHIEVTPGDPLVALLRLHALPQSAGDKPPKQPELPSSLLNHPRYHVLGLVGVGGMGAVY